MSVLIAFFLAKWGSYWAFCSTAPAWFSFAEISPRLFGARWAAIRFLIGLAAGFPIAFLFLSTHGLGLFLSYAVSFVPIRFIEWIALFKLISRGRSIPFGRRAWLWILGGVLVSSLFDLIGWFALEFGNPNLKFFC